MTIKVGINGFGRIGRSVFKIIEMMKSDIEVVHINDLGTPNGMAHMLKYDSVYGRFNRNVQVFEDGMTVDGRSVGISAEKDPSNLPWDTKQVDIIVESTGVFKTREDLNKHLNAGAKKVILTVPAKDEIDGMFVVGVNDHLITPEMKIVSNASCTTNCLAPVAKVLHDKFGIVSALMTTDHAYTNSQKLVDTETKDLREARAAALNIIPTETGAASAVCKIIPELKGKIDGIALRVPVPVGSIVDLVAVLSRPVTKEEINNAMKEASETYLSGILGVTSDPIVSTDIIGSTYSSIFDLDLTMVMNGTLVKVMSWYDNEWGYSCRVVDLIKRIMN